MFDFFLKPRCVDGWSSLVSRKLRHTLLRQDVVAFIVAENGEMRRNYMIAIEKCRPGITGRGTGRPQARN